MRSQDPAGGEWDVVLKPRRTPLIGYAVAALIALAGITVAVLLREKSTGPILRTADQFAMAGIALIMAAAVILLTRPRLKVGPSGLAVRNALEYRTIGWADVVGISFPVGARWPRVDLEHNEYVPILAIQSADGERAAAAMDSLRRLSAHYRPDLGG